MASPPNIPPGVDSAPVPFSPTGSYFVGGRLVLTGPSPVEMDRERPHLLGRLVSVYGSLFRVRGVESFRLYGDRPIDEGEPVGLVVEPAGPE